MSAIKIGNLGMYWQNDTLYVQDDFGNLIEFSRDMARQQKYTWSPVVENETGITLRS